MTESPSPQITCQADGHVAICPICGHSSEVVVEDVPIVMEKEGIDGPVKVIVGRTSSHDLAAFEEHFRVEHA